MVGEPTPTLPARPPAAERVVVDLDGRLALRAAELRVSLARLAEERVCARECGLSRDPAYMADLELEMAETRCAYAGAVALQLALLRAAFAAPGYG
jgi:hypothetical protein